MEFIAFDFETATYSQMACQLGLVRVVDNQIIEEKSWYIQPPSNKYDEGCVRVHGITPCETLKAPCFSDIWIREIKPYFQNKNIVAHNISFDISVLKKNLAFYNLSYPDILSEKCTYKITNEKLHDLYNYMNIDASQHHNALSDAKMCAMIYIKHLNGEKIGYQKLKPLPSKPTTRKSVIPNFITTKKETQSSNIGFNREYMDAKLKVPNLNGKDVNHVFYNKKVVFTGVLKTISRQKAAEIIYGKGADINSAISKVTDFVIMGENAGPAKMGKIKDLQSQNYNIKILNEDDFLRML